MFAGAHQPQLSNTERDSVSRILSGVTSTWKAWWTCDLETGVADPGIAFTNVAGVDRIDSWTDQISGFVAQPAGAATRPELLADGTNFRGVRLVKCQRAVLYEMQYNGAAIMASGVRPHTVVVGRFYSPDVITNQRIYEYANGATSLLRVSDFSNTSNTWSVFAPNSMSAGTNSNTKEPFVSSEYNDASAGAKWTRLVRGQGRAIVTDPTGTAATSAALTTFSIGGRRIFATLTSDVLLAEIFLFSQQLPPAVEDQLLTHLSQKWGIY